MHLNCCSCNKKVSVEADYKPIYCCSGYLCGCQGLPVNPVFCDNCEKQLTESYKGDGIS